MTGPESRPAAEPIELIARSSPWQQAFGALLGVASALVALLVGDQDWIWALGTCVGAVIGGGAVVVLGGTSLQRGMRTVERALPASCVRMRPPRGEWTATALVYGAIVAWFGLRHRDFALPAALLIVIALLFTLEQWRAFRWERRQGGRLALVPRAPGLRLRHPFRTPEYVLVLDDPGDVRP